MIKILIFDSITYDLTFNKIFFENLLHPLRTLKDISYHTLT